MVTLCIHNMYFKQKVVILSIIYIYVVNIYGELITHTWCGLVKR